MACVIQDWYVALVKSQCCVRGEGSLYETTDLLTKLPQSDLTTIMSCQVRFINLYVLCLWFPSMQVPSNFKLFFASVFLCVLGL